MAVWSEITLSSIENFKDFSPEYYKPLYLDLSKKIREFNVSKIGSVAYVTDGEHGSPQWDKNSEIRYITAEFIGPNFIRDGEMRKISIKQDEKNSRSRLQKNDVLIYSVGAYAGLAAVAEEHLFPANIPRSVAIVRLRSDSKILPGYLSVFLNSKYGIFQSMRLRAGNSQPVLALEKIKQIEIPQLDEVFQFEINELYKKAYNKRILSNKLYIQAQKILEKELKFDELMFEDSICSISSLSDVIRSQRIDAQHFQHKYKKLIEHLSGFPCEKIKNIRIHNRRGVQPRYVNNGTIDVVNSQHLGKMHLKYDEFQKTSFEYYRKNPEAHINENDILIYTTGAYVGLTNVFLKNTQSLASNHVNILRLINEIDPVYMSIVLQSIIGSFQTEMHSRGSAQAELYPSDIDKFIVPILPSGIQRNISQLVRSSYIAQKESDQILEQANNKVEAFIDGGEQKNEVIYG